jgi:predicted nuclease of restriction endonuclease-like (RecB) superfamily
MNENKDLIQVSFESLFKEVSILIEQSKRRVARDINSEIISLYYNLGKLISQNVLDNARADYGKQVLKELSKELLLKYGKGFSETNLRNCMRFYQIYPDGKIYHSLSDKLTWTHIRNLIFIDDELKRNFYIEMAVYERWSVRTMLERIDSMLFERTAISKKPEKTIINELMILKDSKKISPDLTFKDPYVLDFLGLHDSYNEKDLENAILTKMKEFLIELGSDFAFMGQQKRITIDNDDFYIDLLFYHRSWKRLVVIELKLGKFKAEYKGQMELYLRWLEKYEMRENENKPIGLILCAEKKKEQVELMTLDNEQIEIAEYKTKISDKSIFTEKLHLALIEARKEFENR